MVSGLWAWIFSNFAVRSTKLCNIVVIALEFQGKKKQNTKLQDSDITAGTPSGSSTLFGLGA